MCRALLIVQATFPRMSGPGKFAYCCGLPPVFRILQGGHISSWQREITWAENAMVDEMSDSARTGGTPSSVERVFGAATRIAGNRARTDRIDKGFRDSGHSLFDYLVNASGTPAKNARDLVSAGLVDPKDPSVVAVSDLAVPPRQEESRDNNRPGDVARTIMRGAADRQTRVEATALLQHIPRSDGGMASESDRLDTRGVARGFRGLASRAQERSDDSSSRAAAGAFARSVEKGVAERDHQRAPSRKARGFEIE